MKALFLMILLIMSLFCFILTPTYSTFYYLMAVLISICGMIGVSLVLDYRKISRFNWNQEKETLLINQTDKDLVKIAKRYVNGATYDQIKAEFHFSSNEQVNRAIKQRLKETM